MTREFAARAVSTLDDLTRRVWIPAFDLDDGPDPRRQPDKPRTAMSKARRSRKATISGR